jgi:sideroflexin-5
MSDEIVVSLKQYFCRLKHFIDVTSPFSLMHSDSEIVVARDEIGNYKKTGLSNCTVEQLKRYQKMTDAAVHPVTNEIIPSLFRVSAIAPFNVPLVFCMLQCPPSNVPGTLFLHWVNQSYNTACNYANRSGAEQSFESTASAYVLAVGSACGFAYGLGRAYQFAPPAIRQFGVLIPCLATVAANVSNLSFTRIGELVDGTPVLDNDGQVQLFPLLTLLSFLRLHLWSVIASSNYSLANSQSLICWL